MYFPSYFSILNNSFSLLTKHDSVTCYYYCNILCRTYVLRWCDDDNNKNRHRPTSWAYKYHKYLEIIMISGTYDLQRGKKRKHSTKWLGHTLLKVGNVGLKSEKNEIRDKTTWIHDNNNDSEWIQETWTDVSTRTYKRDILRGVKNGECDVWLFFCIELSVCKYWNVPSDVETPGIFFILR